MSYCYDFTADAAHAAAKVYRKHGVRCRVVRTKHYGTRLHVYIDEGDGLDSARKNAREECLGASIDVYYDIVRRGGE